MRQRSSDTRRRFQGAEIRVKDAQIDFELARSYVNAGQIDRAEPLFLRAREEGEVGVEGPAGEHLVADRDDLDLHGGAKTCRWGDGGAIRCAM